MWQLGKLPEGTTIDSVDESTLNDLYYMINLWTQINRHQEFEKLGRMICGDPEDKKGK